MTLSLLLNLTLVFAGLFIIGSILCLPLYRWNLKRFFSSSLWIKIVWWLPIYGIFLLLCYGKPWVAVPLMLLILTLAGREYAPQRSTRRTIPVIVKLYLIFFTLSTLHIGLAASLFDPSMTIALLITICFCSVLSDVCAFFFGTYASWHKLPTWINPNKSWEGVAGQIIGAYAGAALVIASTDILIEWWLVLVIGIASAFGDLFNSIAKRQLDIKDWGQTIPGHGGVLDRMSSLSTAFMAATLSLLIL